MTKPILACFTLGIVVFGQMAGGFTPPTVPIEKLSEKYDVIISGAGTGGCGAAIQAARMGATVLLLDETDYIGGQMNAAAVTSMDEGTTSVRERGLYKELVQRIEKYYDAKHINAETAYWFGHIGVEPHVGREILHEMLADARGKGTLDVALRSQVTKVLKDGDRVTGAEIEVVNEQGKQRRTIRSEFLVDATEWGDVLPLAGAHYRSGNTTSDRIDPKQHIQDLTWTAVVRKYPNGVPDELKLKQAPPGYNDKIETYFKSSLKDGDDMGEPGRVRPWTWFKFIGYRGMPDGTRPPQREITRTHLNFNNDFPATVADIEDRGQRQKTERAAILKTLQLLYYIQTTLGKSDWAVADDEGYDTPYHRAQMDEWIKEQPELEPFRPILYHFSTMAYARESRRMFGEYTMKAGDIERVKRKPVLFPYSIAVGDYAVDLHGSMTPKYLELDLDKEEDIPVGGAFTIGPFAIPYHSLIPEKLDGFLAAEKNFSQSRMSNGATRLQPHTMLIGQAVGATAALSVKYHIQPRSLAPVVVQAALLDAGDVLFYPGVTDLTSENPEWKAVQMVATQGILMPENGKFRPRDPITTDDVQTINGFMNGSLSVLVNITTRRDEFASILSSAGFLNNPKSSHRKVDVKFTASAEESALTITRSEAAQVLAEFMTLQGIARATGKDQTLDWTKLRPASSPTLNGSPALKKALKHLIAAKVIDSEEYWLAHAFEKEPCDGAKVKEVIDRAVKILSPGDTREAAEILVEKRVVTSVDYWKDHAKEGQTCLGQNVQALFRGIDRQLP